MASGYVSFPQRLNDFISRYTNEDFNGQLPNIYKEVRQITSLDKVIIAGPFQFTEFGGSIRPLPVTLLDPYQDIGSIQMFISNGVSSFLITIDADDTVSVAAM